MEKLEVLVFIKEIWGLQPVAGELQSTLYICVVLNPIISFYASTWSMDNWLNLLFLSTGSDTCQSGEI